MPFPSVRVFLARQPADVHRGFDGLAALTRDAIRQDPLAGHLFFVKNRADDRPRIPYWDRIGYCPWYKRLEADTFAFPTTDAESVEIATTDLFLVAGCEGGQLGLGTGGGNGRKRRAVAQEHKDTRVTTERGRPWWPPSLRFRGQALAFVRSAWLAGARLGRPRCHRDRAVKRRASPRPLGGRG